MSSRERKWVEEGDWEKEKEVKQVKLQHQVMSEKGEVRDFYPVTQRHNNNNNNRELTKRFKNLKALYNLKKNIQRIYTHNYTNQ